MKGAGRTAFKTGSLSEENTQTAGAIYVKFYKFMVELRLEVGVM